VSEPHPTSETGAAESTVELTVPADSAYVSVLRTVTASLAARRDFTIEEIDDLRIAVDEASALLLPHASTHSRLSAFFQVGEDRLSVTVAISNAQVDRDDEIDQTSFAWMVLAALADTVRTGLDNGLLSVTLSKTRDPHTR
jgi:serine/threonine-protein kinase RsbW